MQSFSPFLVAFKQNKSSMSSIKAVFRLQGTHFVILKVNLVELLSQKYFVLL